MDYNAENPEVKVSWKKKLKKIGLWAWIILTAFLLLCADVFTQDKETLRETIKKNNENYKQLELTLQEKSKELRETKKELTAQLTEAQEALAAAQAELATAQESSSAAADELAAAQAEVEKLGAELAAAQEELNSVKAELDAALAAQTAEEAEAVSEEEEAVEEAVEENPVAVVLADPANSVTLNVLNADGRSVLNVKLPADEATVAVVAEVLGSEDAASCVLRVVTGSGATAKFTSVDVTVDEVKEALGL